MMEESVAGILEALYEVLKRTRAGSDITKMKHRIVSEYDCLVDIEFENRPKKIVDITCDSGIAIIKDVIRAIE